MLREPHGRQVFRKYPPVIGAQTQSPIIRFGRIARGYLVGRGRFNIPRIFPVGGFRPEIEKT